MKNNHIILSGFDICSLAPYESRGNDSGYLHADCIKCGRCITACANGQAIDIMKNHIRHRLYPQKIAENEEETN